MQNIFQPQAMALAEAAIRVRYVGRLFEYASFTAASTSGELVLSLGVSNTDLAAAVTAMETVFTSVNSSDRMDDIVNIIRWWKSTTSGAEVQSGDFECDLLHCIASETPDHASVDKFEEDAGSTNNLVAAWREVLLWDNNVNSVGWVSRRIPHPGISKAGLAIDTITGDVTTAGTQMTNKMIRYIYDDEGTALYTSAVTTNNGDADFNIKAGARGAPWAFKSPVIVRDSVVTPGSNASEVTQVNTVVMWDLARMPL